MVVAQLLGFVIHGPFLDCAIAKLTTFFPYLFAEIFRKVWLSKPNSPWPLFGTSGCQVSSAK